MKKLFAVALAAVMLLALCACGIKTDDKKETNNTTQPVGDTDNTSTSRTKVYYQTDAAGSTITTVIVLPEDGESFPIKTIAPTEEGTTTTTAPTFTYEDDNQFNDATLAW